MERTPGHSAFSGAGRKLHSNLLPGCLQGSPSAFSQHVMLALVLLAIYSARQVLSATRNDTYVQEVAQTNVSIWDENREKTQGKCSEFHDDRFPELFHYWPEDSALFHHCCYQDCCYQPGFNITPRKFKYNEFGQEVQYAIYRDVGYFDQCLPFWRCRETYRAILKTHLIIAICEKTDLTRLYWSRFWEYLVWKYSFLQTVLPWIPVMEVAVIVLALAVFPLTWQHAGENPAKASGWKDLVPTGRIWLKSTWKRVLMDWGHLYLLAMVGNGLMETMRRQNVYAMQTKLFFSYSMLYVVLFAILSAASVMQQLAYWIGSATEPKVLDYWVGKMNEGQALSPRTTKNTLNVQPSRAGMSALAKHTSSKVSFASENDGHPYIPSDVTAALTPRSKLVHKTANYHGGSSSHVENNLESQPEIDTDEEKSILRDDSSSIQLFSVLRRFMCCCLFSKNASGVPPKLKKTSRSLRKYLSVHVFEMGDDYKWQPIATQAAILFALASFLTFPVDDDEKASDLFEILLGYLVQAGCLWSGIYAVLVLFQRAAYIARFFIKLRNKDSDDSHSRGYSSDTRFLEFRGSYQMHSKLPVRLSP